MAPPAQYIEASALKKKKIVDMLSPILIGSRSSLVEGHMELEQGMDGTHFKQQPYLQSSVTLEYNENIKL